MTPSQEGWPTKAKEAPAVHEVRLVPLVINPVFLCLREEMKKLPRNFGKGRCMSR